MTKLYKIDQVTWQIKESTSKKYQSLNIRCPLMTLCANSSNNVNSAICGTLVYSCSLQRPCWHLFLLINCIIKINLR